MNFQQTGRIGNDTCDLSQRAAQNKSAISYMVNPVKPTGTGMNFGLNNNMQMKNSHSTAGLANGLITKQKERISLKERQFLTVPYLGKGRHNVDLETQLRTHKWEPNCKSANPSSEKNLSDYQQTPMLQDLRSSITNPRFLVEEAADKNWRRGGESSRDLARE